MWKHIAAVCTAVVLAAAGNWGAAAAGPAAPAPSEPRPVSVHATISPRAGHRTDAGNCAGGTCALVAGTDPAPAAFSAAVVPRTGTPAVSRGNCPTGTTGYGISAPATGPLLTLALDSRDARAGVRSTPPDPPRSASACVG